MQIEKKNIDELKAAEYNPRKALKKGDKEYEKIKRSIEQFGFVEPVIWNKKTGRIVGGHQRITVLKDMGVKEVECVVVSLDEKKEKALNVALNKITGEWDEEKLSSLITELSEKDFDVTLTGFDEDEIEAVMASASASQIEEDNFDVDSELEKPAFSKYGDLWILGEHRLLCGDSTKIEDVDKLCNDKSVDLYVTDPPYGVNIGNKGKIFKALGLKQGYGNTDRSILNDDLQGDKLLEFLEKAFVCADKKLKDGGSFYIWHADTEGYSFRKACQETNWKIQQCIIWVKNSFVIGRQDYQFRHEPCLFGWKDGAKRVWYSSKNQSSVLEYNRPVSSKLHPTMKPLQLIGQLIENSSKQGDVVMDSFAGSGTTLIACHELMRKCVCIELDPKYSDVIVNRFIELTGEKENIKCIRDGLEYSYDEIRKMAE